MGLVSNTKDGDDVSVRQAIARLGSSKLGPTSTPTFLGVTTTNLTISGLTTNSLIYPVDGLLTSLGAAADGQLPIGDTGGVPVLANITGGIDRISVTNGAGTIALDLAANTQTLLDSFNGIFLETIDFTVSEAGGTVTGSLEKDGTGDLIQRFSDGYSTLDCSPALTINLTAYVGTDAVPAKVFVYILQSAKTVIAASNADWPVTEHIKIANLLLRSAATTGTDGGALVNRNWNDHAQSADSQGHVTHIEERIRQEPTQWNSGVALTLKDSAGNALTTGNSSTAVELVTATGVAYQMHRHTFAAVDMYTTATDLAHIVNQPTNEGGAYKTTSDLVGDIAHYVDGTAAGAAIGVNKYFNLVVWGVMNRTGEQSHLMINLPIGQYTTEAAAIADDSGYSVFDIPAAFKGVGFLIVRLTFRLIAGAEWTYIAQEDLRGQIPPATAGVSVSTTAHDLLSNLDFASTGHTGFQAQSDAIDSIAALGAIADNEFIVGNGAGTYAHESGATVRTSLGLGTGDSPQFTGIELGHADDTTITRSAAGVIAVQGVNVMMAGDAPAAHSIASHNDTTGTGAELNTLTGGGDVGALHTHAAAYQPLNDVLTDLAALSAVADNEFIVGTGAGAYAHENAATAATSMGLGVGDSPTFSNLTVTNTFSIADLLVTGDSQLGDTVNLDTVGINVAPDADILIKGSFASVGSGATFCYNHETFTHTEDDSTAATYVRGTDSTMQINDDLSANGTLAVTGHRQFVETSLTTITGVGTPTAYLYGYHAVVDWGAAELSGATYAAGVVGYKADVTGNLGTTGNTIKWGADISVSESAVTNYGGRFTAQGATYNYGVWGYTTGAHTTNYGLYGYAAGAATNWGLYVAAGNAFFAGIASVEGASVTVGEANATTGTLVLHDSGSANTITLTVPDSLAGSLSFTLPPTDGANTNVLQTNGSGVLTWVAATGGAAGGGTTNIFGQFYNSITQGSWELVVAAGYPFNYYFWNTTHNDADEIHYSTFLAAGTYTLKMTGLHAANQGIVDIYIDAAEVASFDKYAAVADSGYVESQTGIVVAASGVKNIKVIVDGKHASSTNHYCAFSCITLFRTA